MYIHEPVPVCQPAFTMGDWEHEEGSHFYEMENSTHLEAWQLQRQVGYSFLSSCNLTSNIFISKLIICKRLDNWTGMKSTFTNWQLKPGFSPTLSPSQAIWMHGPHSTFWGANFPEADPNSICIQRLNMRNPSHRSTLFFDLACFAFIPGEGSYFYEDLVPTTILHPLHCINSAHA